MEAARRVVVPPRTDWRSWRVPSKESHIQGGCETPSCRRQRRANAVIFSSRCCVCINPATEAFSRWSRPSSASPCPVARAHTTEEPCTAQFSTRRTQTSLLVRDHWPLLPATGTVQLRRLSPTHCPTLVFVPSSGMQADGEPPFAPMPGVLGDAFVGGDASPCLHHNRVEASSVLHLMWKRMIDDT